MSLLSPIFLLGLAALAVPVLVHLVRRTRAKRIEFASLMFVRRVPQRTIRRKRLHNLLLLLLRCLALLLLILAFTRPYLDSNSAQAAKGERASVVLLDTSFSMRYGDRFERAKTRAREIINEARSGEQLALVSFGQGYDVVSRFTTDTGKLRSLLETLPAGLSSTNYEQALRGAETLLKETGAPTQTIYLISDYQAAGWSQADSLFRLSQQVKLVPIDISLAELANLAVTDVSAQPMIYQQKYTDRLIARVANYGEIEVPAVTIEFKINDHTVEKRQIGLGAKASQLIEFTDFNLTAGANRCVIEVGPDNFPLDNNFYFTLHRAEQAKALVIETAVRGRSESLYLHSALTTGENLPFTVAVKTAGAVNPTELSDYRVIILNDAGGLNAALAGQLASFVEKGGGLIIAAGPHLEAGDLNNALKAIAPATLEEKVNPRKEFVALSEVKLDHPIFAVFRQSGRLAVARVFGYHRAAPLETSAVLARFEDGSPALIERAHGNGKVLLFTSTFDASWNDLPLTPLYLPLVRQMVRYLGERERTAWHQLGQTFTVAVDKSGLPPPVDAPNGERLTEQTQSTSGDLIITGREPGFYRLRYPDRADFAAVDLDGKESDLTKLSVNEFVAAVTGADLNAAQPPAAPPKLTDEELEAQQRVWWSLLIAALALFIAEAILARRTKMARVIG